MKINKKKTYFGTSRYQKYGIADVEEKQINLNILAFIVTFKEISIFLVIKILGSLLSLNIKQTKNFSN